MIYFRNQTNAQGQASASALCVFSALRRAWATSRPTLSSIIGDHVLQLFGQALAFAHSVSSRAIKRGVRRDVAEEWRFGFTHLLVRMRMMLEHRLASALESARYDE